MHMYTYYTTRITPQMQAQDGRIVITRIITFIELAGIHPLANP